MERDLRGSATLPNCSGNSTPRRLKKRCRCISCGWVGRHISQLAIQPRALHAERSIIRMAPANVGSVAAKTSSDVSRGSGESCGASGT
jgi:hypothetical protein